jgi:hypothetical protein
MTDAVDISAEAIGRSIAELMGWLTGPDSGQNDGLITAANQLAALAKERDALQAFKAYTHERLSGAGIPTHPEGKHSAKGCRVGDRFDLLIAKRDAALAEAQGYFRDASHAESVADEWKKRAEELAEKAEKFIWQVRDTCARAEKAEAEAARLREALADIEAWTAAYPTDVFPPVDLAAIRAQIGDGVFSRLHGEWARHLLSGIGKKARAALAQEEPRDE